MNKQAKKTFPPRSRFSYALRLARQAKGLSQESFDLVSGRTFISELERDLKSPTLSKVDDLAGVLEVHPLALLTLGYLMSPGGINCRQLLDQICEEVMELLEPQG